MKIFGLDEEYWEKYHLSIKENAPQAPGAWGSAPRELFSGFQPELSLTGCLIKDEFGGHISKWKTETYNTKIGYFAYIRLRIDATNSFNENEKIIHLDIKRDEYIRYWVKEFEGGSAYTLIDEYSPGRRGAHLSNLRFDWECGKETLVKTIKNSRDFVDGHLLDIIEDLKW